MIAAVAAAATTTTSVAAAAGAAGADDDTDDVDDGTMYEKTAGSRPAELLIFQSKAVYCVLTLQEVLQQGLTYL
jgi:hypothetical protein